MTPKPSRARALRVASATAFAAALVCAIAVAGSEGPAQEQKPASPQTSSKQKNRLFQAVDLGLLEAPDRDEWQKPDQIMDTLRIAEGSVVADVGAAGGWFTMKLARRVGPNGVVYAEDIQREMITGVARRAQREHVPWVRPILGTAADPRLPAGIDAILIADVYHEVEDPVALLRNAARSLKPQGLLGVVDFLPGGGGPGPAPDERPDPAAVVQAAEAADLNLVKREDIPPFVFLLVFERANRATP
ncbi:MAG TPA: class I SAM-dependent methyltransferase [Vicinamibacterales bacterium]|jgi:SAM-dependent methyltransferase